MLIEAAKGGHTHVVQLLLDFPNNVMIQQQVASAAAAAAAVAPHPPGLHSNGSTQPPSPAATPTATQTTPGLHEVPEAVRAAVPPHEEAAASAPTATSGKPGAAAASAQGQSKAAVPKSLLRKFRPSINLEGLTPAAGAEKDVEKRLMAMEKAIAVDEYLAKGLDPELLSQKSITQLKDLETKLKLEEEKILQKKILEELQRVEEELQVTSPHILLGEPIPPEASGSSSGSSSSASPPATKVKVLDIPLDELSKGMSNIASIPPGDITFSNIPPNLFSPLCTATLPASFYGSPASKVPPHLGQSLSALSQQGIDLGAMANQTGFSLASMPSLSFQAPQAVTSASSTSIQNAPVPTAAQILGDVPTTFHTAPVPPDSTTLGFNVASPTTIQERPKAKPVSKKDGKLNTPIFSHRVHSVAYFVVFIFS
jgi:hypothetical protein